VLPAEAPDPVRHAQRPARALRLRTALAAAVASVAVFASLAGCGSDDDGDDPTVSGAETNLIIDLDADGPAGKPNRSAQISCAAGQETSPCPQLAEVDASDLAPVPPQTACTEIYGGPDVVTVTGTLHGEPVDAKLSRANGCEIDRFERFLPVVEEVFAGYEPGASLPG